MGFWPDVRKGDKVQHNALLENNVRHLINSLNGFGAGSHRSTSNGVVRIQIWNASGEPISPGQPVAFDNTKPLCGDAVPAVKVTDTKKPWGVCVKHLPVNSIGDCIVAGPASVPLTGGSGDYAAPVVTGTGFTRSETGSARVLYAGTDGKGIILLAGGAGDNPCRVRVINEGYSVVYAGTPVMLYGSTEDDEYRGFDAPFRASVANYSDWNAQNARCIAVCETDIGALGGEGTAIVSGIARGFWWRLTHSDPQIPAEGDLICPSSERFVPLHDEYEGPTAKIVRIGNYNSERSGIEVQVLLGGGSRVTKDSFQCNGPWALKIWTTTIGVNPGLVWTPDGTYYISPNDIPKPAVSSLILFSIDNHGHQLVSIPGSGIDSMFNTQGQYTDYFNTNALLGWYDAENDIVVQYHFSPIVYMIETEAMIIEP